MGLAIDAGHSVYGLRTSVASVRGHSDLRDEALVAEDGRWSEESDTMVLGHQVARRPYEQYPLHDGVAAEQQEIRCGRCQPECDDDRNRNSGYLGLRPQLRAFTRLHLGYKTLAMEVDPRLKRKDKYQQTHADNKTAFQKVVMFQNKAHQSTVIQKQ